jgi:hypothetical protein
MIIDEKSDCCMNPGNGTETPSYQTPILNKYTLHCSLHAHTDNEEILGYLIIRMRSGILTMPF